MKIPGIRKVHQITFINGGLKTRLRSCLICLQLQQECESCAKEPFTVSPDKLITMLAANSPIDEPGDEDAENFFESLSDLEDTGQEKSDDELGNYDDREVMPYSS